MNFVSVFRWRPSCLASLTMWARVGPFCGSTRRQQKSERGRTTLTSMTEEFEGPEVIARRMRLVLPNGRYKELWDWFVLTLVLYNALVVPFGLAFFDFTDFSISVAGGVFDAVVDTCFILDLMISFRTTFYDFSGNLVLDRKRVRSQYFRTWFWPDLVASIPYEHLVRMFSLFGGQGSIGGQAGLLKLAKLAKLLRLARLAKKFEKLAAAKAFRVLQLTCILLICAHWYACIWFWMGSSSPVREEGIVGTPGANGTSWIFRLEMEDEDLSLKYTASLYWALTMVMKSPWFHPIAPGEFAFACIFIIIGCVLFAYFIGNVTAVITAANASSGKYRDSIGALRSFSRSHGLTEDVTGKLLVYCDALWTEKKGGIDRRAMLNQVPSHLLPQVIVQLYRPLLDACPFFYDCTSAGCVAILQLLRVEVCDGRDVLMVAGSLQSIFYILMRGEIRIEVQDHPQKHTVESYVPGGRIGGIAHRRGTEMGTQRKLGMHGRTDKAGSLLGFHDVFEKMQPLEYSVRAVTRCSLLSITRGQLKDVLTAYTEDRAPISKAIELAESTLAQASHRRKGPKSPPKMSLDTDEAVASQGGPTSPALANSATADAGSGAASVGNNEQVEALRSEVAELRSALTEHTLLLRQLLDSKQSHAPASAELVTENA